MKLIIINSFLRVFFFCIIVIGYKLINIVLVNMLMIFICCLCFVQMWFLFFFQYSLISYFTSNILHDFSIDQSLPLFRMCDQTEVSYLPDDVVWVKLGCVWWPAQVQDLKKLSEDVTSGLRKKPLAVVKFFDEDLLWVQQFIIIFMRFTFTFS